MWHDYVLKRLSFFILSSICGLVLIYYLVHCESLLFARSHLIC